MPYINLIEEQRITIRANERKARLSLFGGVGAFCFLGLYGFSLGISALHVKGETNKMRVEKQKLAPMQRQITDDQTIMAGLEPRIGTLEKAQTLCTRWADVLNHLATNTPSDVWLTGIQSVGTDPTKPITSTISGGATSQAPVSEFIFRLENSPDLANINLRYTQEKSNAKERTTEFQVDTNVIGTEERKADKDKSQEDKAS